MGSYIYILLANDVYIVIIVIHHIFIPSLTSYHNRPPFENKLLLLYPNHLSLKFVLGVPSHMLVFLDEELA